MGKRLLLLLSFLTIGLFTLFSYTVAKEMWQQFDFDLTVKLQDHIPRRFDEFFSYFSVLGSAEVTIGLSIILAFLSLVRRKFLSFIGWLIIIPASLGEVFGKLVVFHPGPPVLFHRSILETHLPSFYIHTNFSYPSGHVTRTIFLVTVFLVMILLARFNPLIKVLFASIFLIFAFMMFLTRIYLGEHWFSDCIGGGLLGLSTGFFSAALMIRKKHLQV